jgi:hypothetical protein
MYYRVVGNSEDTIYAKRINTKEDKHGRIATSPMSIEDLCYECFPNLIVAIKTLQHGDKLPSYKDNHGFWVLWLQFSVALLPLELFAGAEWHFAMLIFASWANTFNDADKCTMWGLIAFMRSIQTDLKTMTRSTSFYISMAGVTLDDKNLVHLFKNKWPLMYQNHIRNVTVDLCGVYFFMFFVTVVQVSRCCLIT